jgi:membrane protease YdiL (CAAX protease family)
MMNSRLKCKYPSLIVFAAILIAWTGAWILQLALASRFEAFGHERTSFFYWLIAKIIIWILPAFWIVQKCNLLKELFSVRSWKKTLAWGCGIGGIQLTLSIGYRILNVNSPMPYMSPFSFLDVAVIAPVFEEFLMRGAILSSLKKKVPFITANIITAFLFMLLHCPGWYFTGVLQTQFLSPFTGASAIFIIGLLCGLAAEKGKSLYAAMIVHLLNNLF